MPHLTLDDRFTIERLLKAGNSISAIALSTGRAVSTISREIKKHSVSSHKIFYGRIPNCCIYRRNCTKMSICEAKPDCTKAHCYTCKHCNSVCPSFEEELCTKLLLPPYVCNGCSHERKCSFRKRYYIHKAAHKDYLSHLAECRSGANLTEGELLQLDEFFSPLILRGQSIHHICANNPNQMFCSEKSLYRYVASGLLAAKNIDMPRVVRMKPRKSKPVHCKIDKQCYIGRTYSDFLEFCSSQPDLRVVEMDTVEGVKGGKVLLTLHFKGDCDLMLAFLRQRNTAQSVMDIFESLYAKLGADVFSRLFPAFLTDRGTEFSNPTALEKAPDGSLRTRVFYCNPQASWQKPNVELNHEMIRRILPKGRSFDHLVQDDIDLMMSHINSYGRKKLNDKSPYETFSFLFGQDILEALHIEHIPPNDIALHPSLLKK